MKRSSGVVWIWILSALAVVAVIACAFVRIDVPVARHFWKVSRFLTPVGTALGSVVILAGEWAVLTVIGLIRIVRGQVSPFSATLATACLASMGSYVVNGHVLKVLGGVPNIAEVMHGARHVFHIGMGSDMSSFPSGHMVLAGAFAGVFMRAYSVSRWPLGAALLLAGVLLVTGDWHFVSDVLAGLCVGLAAGLLAGLLAGLSRPEAA